MRVEPLSSDELLQKVSSFVSRQDGAPSLAELASYQNQISKHHEAIADGLYGACGYYEASTLHQNDELLHDPMRALVIMRFESAYDKAMRLEQKHQYSFNKLPEHDEKITTFLENKNEIEDKEIAGAELLQLLRDDYHRAEPYGLLTGFRELVVSDFKFMDLNDKFNAAFPTAMAMQHSQSRDEMNEVTPSNLIAAYLTGNQSVHQEYLKELADMMHPKNLNAGGLEINPAMFDDYAVLQFSDSFQNLRDDEWQINDRLSELKPSDFKKRDQEDNRLNRIVGDLGLPPKYKAMFSNPPSQN